MFHRHTKAGTICRPVSGGMIPAVLLFHYFSCDCPLCTPMARRGQVRRIDKITPFKSGTKLSALCVYFIYIADLIGLEFQPCGQECFNVKSVLVIRVGSVLEIGVLGNVVLIRKERTHATQLEDALVSVHRRKLILAHQLFPQFLIVERVGSFPSTALSGVVGVNGFLAQHGSQLLEGGWLLTAQENGSIHVADDGICIVLIDRLELTLRLQHQTGGDLTASDGGDQLFQTRNLPDIGGFINETAHMDREPAAIHIVGFFAEQVEKLGITHGNKEVEAIVSITHDEEQGSFPVSQSVQLQLIIGRDLTQLCNVEYRKARTTGNQDRLGCFSRDEKSRTFSSNSQTSYILLNLVAKQTLDFVLHCLSGVLVEVDTDDIGRAVYLLSDGGCGVLGGGLCCCVSVFCHSIPPVNEKCPTRKG